MPLHEYTGEAAEAKTAKTMLTYTQFKPTTERAVGAAAKPRTLSGGDRSD